jgi:hypothetical protein
LILSVITIIVASLALWAPNKKKLRVKGYITIKHVFYSKHNCPIDGKPRREGEVICNITVTNTGNRPVILTVVSLLVFMKRRDILDSEDAFKIIGYSPGIEFKKQELKPAEMYEQTYSTSNTNITDTLSLEDLEIISKGRCFIHVFDTEGKKYRVRLRDFENKAKELLKIENLQFVTRTLVHTV